MTSDDLLDSLRRTLSLACVADVDRMLIRIPNQEVEDENVFNLHSSENDVIINNKKERNKMKYEFSFNGGVKNQEQEGDDSQKFLIFLINNKKEISMGEAHKSNMILSVPYIRGDYNTGRTYNLDIPIVKVFYIRQSRSGGRYFYSIYIDLREQRELITMKDGEMVKDWFFSAEGKVLNKEESLKVISPDSMSYSFLKRAKDAIPPIVKMEKLNLINVQQDIRKLREF